MEKEVPERQLISGSFMQWPGMRSHVKIHANGRKWYV